jgi:hypothetical protein
VSEIAIFTSTIDEITGLPNVLNLPGPIETWGLWICNVGMNALPPGPRTVIGLPTRWRLLREEWSLLTIHRWEYRVT